MRQKDNKKVMFSALATVTLVPILWLALPLSPVQAGGDPIVVIVNVANPVDNLSLGELKKLFLSDRSRWDTGKAVAPVIFAPGAPERTAFLKEVCGMNDSDFGKYFLQAAFTGKSATAPKEVSSSAGLKTFVANSPGAIGFLKAGDFHGDGSDGGVKAVKIDGTAAGDASYKLRM
jgi:ABC-type phosphate transport system substrate-binding protein